MAQLEYLVTAHLIDMHGSRARCKGAAIPLDIDVAGRADAFNPAAYHARAALKVGATRREIAATAALAVFKGDGPAAVHGTEAIRSLDEYAQSTDT